MNNVFFLLATILGAYLCMVGFALLLVKLIFPWKSENEGSDGGKPVRWITPGKYSDQRKRSDTRHRPASKRKIRLRDSV